MDNISKIFRKYVLPIYWAFLTFMLLKPGTENKEYWFMFNGIDKLLHVSIFILLGFTFKAAFPKTRFVIFIQIMLCYAFLTEILQDQMHLGRALEGFDVIADIIGSLIGFYLFKLMEKKYL